MNQQLGKLLGEVQAVLDAYDNDPMSQYAPSECRVLNAKHATRQVWRMLRDAGYEYASDFEREVRERTTERWAYFHGNYPTHDTDESEMPLAELLQMGY